MADTPKAIEPTRLSRVIHQEMSSGRQMGWCEVEAPSPTTRALKVVRLNQSVPTNCTKEAHQSMRLCCTSKSCLKRRCAGRSRCGFVVAASKYWRKAAVVKKMEPMK